jgi:hypothetical protein
VAVAQPNGLPALPAHGVEAVVRAIVLDLKAKNISGEAEAVPQERYDQGPTLYF